jgi:hypothetical protein
VAPVGFGALAVAVRGTLSLNAMPVFALSTLIFLSAWYRRDRR